MKVKENKGITLISLIITIILLLILAGISIASLTGKNGILSKANTAKTDTEREGAKEKVEMAVMSSFDDNGKLDYTQLKNNLDNVEGIDKRIVPDQITKLPIMVKVDGYEVTIDENEKVIVGENKNLPIGDTIKPGEIVTGGNKKYTNNGTAVIPEGFSIVPGCDDVSQGLVISDDAGDTEVDNSNIVANGNQFVWVPVTNMDNFKTVAGYERGSLQGRWADCIEPFANGFNTEVAEYNSMKQSVEENQGFYIGRYEAGKDSEGNLVVKKNLPVYNNIKWGISMTDIREGAVELSKNFTNEKNYQGKITSTLIYGVQWDATMQFFDSNYIAGACDENSYVRDSTNKGNYNLENLINTGSNENYKVKNIYDMAGNVWEWTMEAYYTGRRVLRGGRYGATGNTDPVSIRSYGSYTTEMGDNVGFRVALVM